MKVLINITSYSSNHEKYLLRVLGNFATNYADLDLFYVLSINYPFDIKLPSDKFVRLDKTFDIWNYTWNGHAYLRDHYADFDYVINQDDDVLIPRAAFNYYVTASTAVDNSSIPGLLVAEQDKECKNHLITVVPFVKDARVEINGEWYLKPTFQHSACMIADRARFAAIASQTQPAWASLYNPPQASRTMIYTKLQKVIPISAIRDKSCFVQHLPNKYHAGLWKRPHSCDDEVIASMAGL